MSERTRFLPVQCELCRGTVDADTADRARRSWRPLVVCADCVRGARGEAGERTRQLLVAA